MAETLTEALADAETIHVADHPDLEGVWCGVREHGPGRWLAIHAAAWIEVPLALTNHQGEYLIWDTAEQAAQAAEARAFTHWPSEPLCEERLQGWGTCWTDWSPREASCAS